MKYWFTATALVASSVTFLTINNLKVIDNRAPCPSRPTPTSMI